ncbi:hypothetical protein [Aurantimonas sp. 22II-16-19i]|uniref:hypothetical protein n=1 Tax=Aurantimonas sp. 22II-16-19i TaxID=1317114 RepID=UPI00111C7AF1|nr:hypothetical protein [Aurantimonas sp. 22II-16-19i]
MESLINGIASSDSVFAAFAAVFLWLYIDERKKHTATNAERITDLKSAHETVAKSISLLDDARKEFTRTGARP